MFWNDPAQKFAEVLPELSLNDLSLPRLDENPARAVKIRLEQEDPTARYLLYAPFEPPDPDKDWLLHMRLYSASFSADRASMLLADIGLTQQSLREHHWVTIASRSRYQWR